MEWRRHYWNGRWGRSVREDILVSQEGGVWLVEARHGGTDGASRWFEVPDEDTALDWVRDLIHASEFDGWRELTLR